MPHGATYGWETGFVIDYGQRKSEDYTLRPTRDEELKPKKDKAALKAERKAKMKKMVRDATSFFGSLPLGFDIYRAMKAFAKEYDAECTKLIEGNPYAWMSGCGIHLEVEQVGSDIVLKKTSGKQVIKVCLLSDKPWKWVDPSQIRHLYRLNAKAILKERKDSSDWILHKIQSVNLRYVDNRPNGGALWVAGGSDLYPLMSQFKMKGVVFSLSQSGGDAFQGEPAWFFEERSNQQNEPKVAEAKPRIRGKSKSKLKSELAIKPATQYPVSKEDAEAMAKQLCIGKRVFYKKVEQEA